MKLSLKITLLFVVIVLGIMGVMMATIYNISSRNIAEEHQDRLETHTARTANLYTIFSNNPSALNSSIGGASLSYLANKSIVVYSINQQPLYEYHDEGTFELAIDSTWFDKVNEKTKYYFTEHRGKDVCIYFEERGENSFYVFLAAENISGKNYIKNLKNIFLIFLPVGILITLLTGYFFSRSIVKPIKRTIDDVKMISSQNLSQRLEEGSGKDELAELNETFNDLLNRLEESFATQRKFISNASHELSTPLTSISSQIEVTLLQARSEEEYRRVLHSVLEDVKELQQLTKTLLEIAKAGRHGAITLEKARLDEILIRSHSEVKKENPYGHVELAFSELPDDEEECSIFGNILLLNSAFKNVLENGCKYSLDNTVHVSLFFHKTVAEIVFTNKSETLSQEDIDQIFEPFFRSGNAEGKPGFGLGLTLSRRIISLHKGTLDLSYEEESGVVCVIKLPTLKNKLFNAGSS